MKKVTAGTEVFGPFSSVIDEAEKLICDDVILYKIVIGEYLVSDVLESDFGPDVESRKALLIKRCKEDREAKTNTNETVPFPVDIHEIQTSNEIDIRNLLVKTTAAIAIAGAGGGSRNYSYTTAAKVRITMTVQQFVSCSLSIMAIKDQIFEDYETLRVSIENAADSDALDVIESNWPT